MVRMPCRHHGMQNWGHWIASCSRCLGRVCSSHGDGVGFVVVVKAVDVWLNVGGVLVGDCRFLGRVEVGRRCRVGVSVMSRRREDEDRDKVHEYKGGPWMWTGV